MSVRDHNYNRIKEVDFLKGIAILAVLLVHTSWNFIRANDLSEVIIFNAILNNFSRFAVPLFVFVSGVVLSYKYHQNFNIGSFYSKRIRSILPEYIIFSVFYMLCEIVYLNRMPTTKEVIINWIIGGYGYLWFIVLIMQLYILFPFVINIYKRYNAKSQYLLLVSFVVELLWSITDLGMPKEFLFPSGIFYFMLGIYTYDHIIAFDLKSTKSYLVISFIIIITLFISYRQILDIANYGGFENIPIKHPTSSVMFSIILYTLIIVLIYSVAIDFKDRINMVTIIIYSLGIYSFGIFLVHFFYQQLITVFLSKIGITFDNVLFYVILFIGMLSLSYATCYIISRLPFGKYIVGFAPIKKIG